MLINNTLYTFNITQSNYQYWYSQNKIGAINDAPSNNKHKIKCKNVQIWT